MTTTFNYCYFLSESFQILDSARIDGTSGSGLNQSEFLARYPKAEFMLWDTAEDLMRDAKKHKYLNQAPIEIDEETYDDCLGCMPPYQHTGNGHSSSFLLAEAQIDNIHPAYVYLNKRFYKIFAERGTSHEDLIERIENYRKVQSITIS